MAITSNLYRQEIELANPRGDLKIGNEEGERLEEGVGSARSCLRGTILIPSYDAVCFHPSSKLM